MSDKDKRSTCFGDFHEFQPRYDEGIIDKEILDRLLNASDGLKVLELGDKTSVLKERLGGKKYIGDICTQCGMKVDRSENSIPRESTLSKNPPILLHLTHEGIERFVEESINARFENNQIPPLPPTPPPVRKIKEGVEIVR